MSSADLAAANKTTTEHVFAESNSLVAKFDRKTGSAGTVERRIALLTGGGDKDYAVGLTKALTAAGVSVDFIGSDDLAVPEILNNPRVRFLNLRGDVNAGADAISKVVRVLRYYVRLIGYAVTARPKLFHILWNNKFETIDRTLLLLFYRLCGKRIVHTVHNVNAAERDDCDTWFNRLTLRIQYALTDHLFVHTGAMSEQLQRDFGVGAAKVTIIPYGTYDTVPQTGLSRAEAKKRLGLSDSHRAMLFFGNIAPYKGLDLLIDALATLIQERADWRLIIAGRPKSSLAYWEELRGKIERAGLKDFVVARAEYIPDEDTEIYLKAADALVLPYRHIFQSGVLFLGFTFGLPAIVTDVGSLHHDVIDGKTGFVCRSNDSADLANTLRKYFESDLYRNHANARTSIRAFYAGRNSWATVASQTASAYEHIWAY